MRRHLKQIMVCLCVNLPMLQSCVATNKDKKMDNSKSEIINAVKEKNTSLVSEVLSAKPDLEQRNEQGRTALMIAVYNADNQIAEALIKAGADVNAQDNMQNSPFLYAGAEGNVQVLNLCLSHGADFKRYNRYGGTALIPASEKGHLAIVEILCKIKNFPINHVNNLGWTALIEAVILSKESETQSAIVKTLVQAGADINITDSDGITPLAHARARKLKDIVQILTKAGAK